MSTHGITRADMHAVNLPRRRATNRLMEALAWLAAAIAVGFLVLIVWSVARRGAGQFNLDLITKTPATGFLDKRSGGTRERVRGNARHRRDRDA